MPSLTVLKSCFFFLTQRETLVNACYTTAHFLFILSQLCCSMQFVMAFSPTLSKYIADLLLTVTGLSICVQHHTLKQSTSRQPGHSVHRRHVGVSQLLLLPLFPCLGSQMSHARPKSKHCMLSPWSGSWGSSTCSRSEPRGQYHCNPCSLRKAGGMVENWKGAQWMLACSWVILGRAGVEGVAGSSKDYTWDFAFITTE